MSRHGILLIDAFGLLLIALIVNLLRTGRLHVGYAVLWMVATAGLMLTVSVPPLLGGVTRAVGAIFPASALSLLAFAFIFVVLIYYSVRLSALTSRQTELVQALALRELLDREGREAEGEASAVTGDDSGPEEA